MSCKFHFFICDWIRVERRTKMSFSIKVINRYSITNVTEDISDNVTCILHISFLQNNIHFSSPITHLWIFFRYLETNGSKRIWRGRRRNIQNYLSTEFRIHYDHQHFSVPPRLFVKGSWYRASFVFLVPYVFIALSYTVHNLFFPFRYFTKSLISFH